MCAAQVPSSEAILVPCRVQAAREVERYRKSSKTLIYRLDANMTGFMSIRGNWYPPHAMRRMDLERDRPKGFLLECMALSGSRGVCRKGVPLFDETPKPGRSWLHRRAGLPTVILDWMRRRNR
jgi:hypothetical protein